jgi:hypothetical protein
MSAILLLNELSPRARITSRSVIETLRDNPGNLRRYPNVPAADDMSDSALLARQRAFEDSEDR